MRVIFTPVFPFLRGFAYRRRARRLRRRDGHARLVSRFFSTSLFLSNSTPIDILCCLTRSINSSRIDDNVDLPSRGRRERETAVEMNSPIIDILSALYAISNLLITGETSQTGQRLQLVITVAGN